MPLWLMSFLFSCRSRPAMWVAVFAVTCVPGALGSDGHQGHNKASETGHKANRKDAAFVAGYDEGHRQGANDSHALANYCDESGPVLRAGDRWTHGTVWRQGSLPTALSPWLHRGL
jgi:hypothetical protein